MRFDVLTLFPEWFTPLHTVGITRRAFDGPLDLHLWPLREHADDAYRRVDDRCYGGGPGMVMLAAPLERALAAARAAQDRADADRTPVLLFSPAGAPLTQARVQALAAGPGAVLVCGRYEGVDQRFVSRHVDEELSLGDFVLSGGEMAAIALLDATARLLPGVLGDADSHRQDSFSDGLLDCPHYSRPERLGEAPEDAVPPVLLSGNHREIARWRRERQLELTARRRPDLIAAAREAGRLTPADERYLSSLPV
jgi:tRNA (guanine37-N1)-methyltransferase